MAISNANANGIPFIKNMRGIPKSIKDAMVLWYDISRQGATNESMIANPILKDFSGNGNDATCYNFAWAGMSGVGGYATEIKASMSNRGGICTIYNGYKLNITHTPLLPSTMMEYEIPVGANVPITYIKVTGLNGITLYGDNQFFDIEDITEDGIYELPAINNSIGTATIYPCLRTTNENIDCDITIELLPLYPNALVSDGVDDYAMVQNRYDTPDLENWVINAGVINANGNKLEIVSNGNLAQTIRYTITKDVKLRLKVDGVSSDNKLRITFGTNIIAEIEDNSIFKYTFIYDKKGNNTISIGGISGITIEQLPINKSLVFNKENGYTIIAKRERLNDLGCLASKRNSSNPDGAFVFELNTGSNDRCDNFNAQQGISYNDDIITWQTSKKYNGITLNIGNAQDNDVLNLFMLYNNYYVQVALYSLLLFNRDLTDDEIDWVKYNLLGEKRPEFDKSLVDGWFFNGTNDNFPNTIAGINGHEMVLYGFDGTAESGFNNGLQFDGVDDYTKVSGLPILDDFTLICHREILQSTNYEVASKAEVWNNGAFQLEISSVSGGGGRSYGALTGYCNIDVSEQVVYMTPTYYKGNNGTKTFNKGTGIDTEYLWLGKVRDADDITTKMNIKYFLLYNKTLTEEEIQSEIEKAEKKFLE